MPFYTMDEGVSLAPEAYATATPPVPIHGLNQNCNLRHAPSEESVRTDLCEGPLLIEEEAKISPESAEHCITATSDRAELIERLKRGESPTWIPNRRHESFFPRNRSREHSPTPRPKSRESTGLLTASLARADRQSSQDADIAERMEQGLSIERPRSALHSGDFTQDVSSHRYGRPSKQETTPVGDIFNTARQSSWFATSPPRDFTPFKFEGSTPFPELSDTYKSTPPSLSSSLSSSFVYKHPTSPLVQIESNEDLGVDSMDLDFDTPSRAPRRQTLHTFSHHMPVAAQRTPSIRRQSTFPYQAHQPRRSLTSAPSFSLTGSSPSTGRRPSVVLDASPLQRTSMVGSYEESILRGRMSTTPSKPLDFMAQIGVLGLGNCKPSLKCPAHVTLPFPAVFYSYSSTSHGRSTSDDGPSPYVGQVDLENGLPNPEESAARRRSRKRSGSLARSRQGSVGPDTEMTGVNTPTDARGIAKNRRRGGASSPKAPPGGSYRIPEKGQLQIIIKNQNKTAVKLFLVPYDLAGMEPGTKTFIRQRAYTPATDTDDKQVLRYLVHLHICCPARGRYYLYKSVRVVFANRVPDGKERLRNEITLPEPRFTSYKPVRQMAPSSSVQSHGSLTRSSGFSFGGGPVEPVPSWEVRRRAATVHDERRMVPERPIAGGFAPLNFAKGEVSVANGIGSGGLLAGASSAAVAEGLLSQRLRSLGMHSFRHDEVDGAEIGG